MSGPDTPSIVFVGGCDRSGTTVVSRLIAEHGNLVMLPEAYFHAVAYRKFGPGATAAQMVGHWRRRSWEIADDDPRATGGPLAGFLIEAMADIYESKRGERSPLRVVESTPENIEVATTLLDQFPAALLVHVVRDPRAVVSSLRRADFGPTTAQECARFWKQRIASGLGAEAAHPERVIRVRYESLMSDPDSIRSVVDRIAPADGRFTFDKDRDLIVDPTSREIQARVADRVDTSRTEAWRSASSERDIAIVEYECRELMNTFGYSTDGAPDDRSSVRRLIDTTRSNAAEITAGSGRRALRILRSLNR